MTYVVLKAAAVSSARPSLVCEVADVASALARARTLQALHGACVWVERHDGAVMGGTFAWLSHGAHMTACERLNVERGFLPPERRAFDRRATRAFECLACGCNAIAMGDLGEATCERCSAPLYRQCNGAVTRYHNRRCGVCGGPAIRGGTCGQCE